MKNLSIEGDPEAIEPEIVGLEPRSPLWRRIVARAALSLALGAIGAGLCLAGTVLTVTVIGAAIGIPLVLIGLCVILLAVFLLFCPRKVQVVGLRFPGSYRIGGKNQ